MERAKSKVTLYVRPELHKLLKLRSVHAEMKMSELAEHVLERYLLEFDQCEPNRCPMCQMEIAAGQQWEALTKLHVNSA